MSNLSEEEIIKECKRIIFEYGCIRQDTEGEKEDLQTLEGLLNLYNKEKEKNKELDREAQGYLEELAGDETSISILYQKEKEKNKLLIEGKFREVADKNSYIKDNYVSKDEIKEEIKELENMKVDGEVFTTAVNFAKKEFQELLED